jgi:hypothetical protein
MSTALRVPVTTTLGKSSPTLSQEREVLFDDVMVSVTSGVLTIPPGIGVGEAYKNVPIAKAMST